MTISHSVSPTDRVPGTRVEFNIDAAARGLSPIENRVALIGQMSSSGTATADEVVQVFTEAEADSLFGIGSELALMCKKAIRAGKAYGNAASLWAIPITNPAVDGSNTQAAYTLTFSGTATESATAHVRICGVDVFFGVASGDAAATAAAACETAADAVLTEVPFTAGVSSAVVTLTAVMTGVNSNDGVVESVSMPAGITCVVAQSVTAIGTVDITTSLDNLVDKDYLFIACANHTSTDITDFASHLTSMWAADEKKWRFTVLAECGSSVSVAQPLATAADDYKQIVVSYEGGKEPEGQVAAYIAATLAAEADPAQPFNSVELPGLALTSLSDIPTQAELNTGIGAGLLMLAPNAAQTRPRIVRAVTTKVTQNSVPFFSMLDVTIPRSMAYTAKQVEIKQALNFANVKKNARTLARIRSVVLDVLHDLEDLEILQNVDDHADELLVETDSVVTTRVNVAIPTSVVPPLNQIVNVVNLLVE